MNLGWRGSCCSRRSRPSEVRPGRLIAVLAGCDRDETPRTRGRFREEDTGSWKSRTSVTARGTSVAPDPASRRPVAHKTGPWRITRTWTEFRATRGAGRRVVDEDAGNVTLPRASCRCPARKEGPGTRCVDLVLYRGPNPRSASVTVERHARKRGLLTISVTRPHLGDGPGTPWSRSRDEPVALPLRTRGARVSLPVTPPTSPGRLGHGHSQPGPWTRRPCPPNPSRVPYPGRQLQTARTLPRAPASPAPSLPRLPRFLESTIQASGPAEGVAMLGG
jgi:hypothetical protein